MSQQYLPQTNGKVMFRIVVCIAILLVGFIGMTLLSKMKQPPAEIVVKERTLQVETLSAKAESVQMKITGFGQVTPLDTVAISPEVSGRIVAVNSRLDQGVIIEKGELLFRIDPSDYETVRDTTGAEGERLKKNIMVLGRQIEIDTQRLISIERNRDLAKAEHERYKKLYQEHEAVSLAYVEKQEQVYNNAKDLAAQLAKTIELYPLQIEETDSALTAAQARFENAMTNLARCEVKAPFTGRITEAELEIGQYVTPGKQVVAMANDAILEIHLPIDSGEARKWLRFKDGRSRGWFTDVEPVLCDIRWTDDDKNIWQGVLHRVVRFNPETRTLTVAVRVENHQAVSLARPRLPLVAGMFCSVTIPGLVLDGVYRLPRWAVSFKETVYLAIGNRLKTSAVEVARIQGEEAFVSKGLKDGDQIITTRLVEPLENSLLRIHNSNKAEKAQKSGSGVAL
nr:biotin/lipoyl-binding protein [Desulfobulbaceae bacterium]